MHQRLVVIVGLLASACTHEVRGPRGDAQISVGVAYPDSYPVAVGTELGLRTHWDGYCKGTEGFSPGFQMRTAAPQFDCDSQEYSLRVECVNDGFESEPEASPPCEILDDETKLTHANRYGRPSAVGEKFFHVKANAKQTFVVQVTLRHGDQTYVQRTPRLRMFVPDNFAIECRTEWGNGPVVSCDACNEVA